MSGGPLMAEARVEQILAPYARVLSPEILAEQIVEVVEKEILGGAVDRVIVDDDAMRRARHAYLNSPPHGVQHTDAARLEHMRAAFRAAFGDRA